MPGARVAVIVARRDIYSVASRVDGGRAPDRRARRPPQLRADFIDLGLLGFLDGVGFPDLLAGGRIQRDQRSAEAAAFVLCRSARGFFARFHGNIHAIFIEHQAAGDACHRVIVHFGLPDFLARRGVDGVRESPAVSEQRGIASSRVRLDLRNGDRRPHSRTCINRPVNAAARGVEGINLAIRATHKDASAREIGRAHARQFAGESEGPLQLESRHLRGREAGGGRVLKARVRGIHAPSVPGGPGCRKRKSTRTIRAHGFRRGCDFDGIRERLARQIFRNRAPLRLRKADRHRDHGSGFHSCQNACWTHLFEGFAAGRAIQAAVMAGRAALLVPALAILRGHDSSREKQQPGRTRDTTESMCH